MHSRLTPAAWRTGYETSFADCCEEAWQAPAYRVLRGGEWNNNANNTRCANRNNNNPDNNWNNNGFRCVRPIFDTSDKNRREEVRFDGGFDVSERKTWCHE